MLIICWALLGAFHSSAAGNITIMKQFLDTKFGQSVLNFFHLPDFLVAKVYLNHTSFL